MAAKAFGGEVGREEKRMLLELERGQQWRLESRVGVRSERRSCVKDRHGRVSDKKRGVFLSFFISFLSVKRQFSGSHRNLEIFGNNGHDS